MSNPETIGPCVAAALNDLNSATHAIQTTDAGTFIITPPAYKVQDISSDLEKLQSSQNRKRGVATLNSVDSFKQYCADQGETESGYIYANVDKRVITAVFNDFKAADAGWRDHRAQFTAVLTPEASNWLTHDGKDKAMGQTDFAEFIEDNFADLSGAGAQNLLTVATTIRASTAINFSSAKRLQDGQTQMVYNEEINATAGSDGTLQIPAKFDLGLRLFKGDEAGYILHARLKYRMNSGKVNFWYELERPERAIEDAFNGYVAALADTGYTVLLGNPGP